MCELFNEANAPYNPRQGARFHSYNVKTVLYGTDTLPYVGPKIWSWFLLISEIAWQNKFFAKRLKSRNQIDVHVGPAKYTFLIWGLLIKNSAT